MSPETSLMHIPAAADTALSLLRTARLVFWDFDGVVKESVAVKTAAFTQLFLPYGPEVAARVSGHHEAHGGLSRYQKMPLYLQWAGEIVTADKVDKFCARFADLVREGVIDAAWVPGVREFLDAQYEEQAFVLVTATPLDEMVDIAARLQIRHLFREIHGSPESKSDAVADVLRRWPCTQSETLFVGDSDSDLSAAIENGVPFVLRRTSLNGPLQARFLGPAFDALSARASTEE